MLAYLYRAYSIFLLTRPVNALQPIILAIAGCAIAGVQIDSLQTYALLAAIFLVHGAVTMWNDMHDVEIDKRNGVVSILTAGYINSEALRWVVIGQLFIVACLFYFLPPLAWAMLAILILIGWQYSSQPFMLSRRPILSMIALAVSYGFLPLLLGATLGNVSLAIIILAVFWSLSRVSLSLLKDYKDAIGDAQHNKRTFLLVFGHRKVRIYSLLLAVVGNAGIIYLTSQYVSSQLIVLFYILAGCLFAGVAAWRYKLYSKATYEELNQVFHQCLYLQLALDGVIVACLMLS